MAILLGMFLIIWAFIGLFWVGEYLVSLWKFDRELHKKKGELPVVDW